MARVKQDINTKRRLSNQAGTYQPENDEAGTPMVCFIGTSNSGKTTLLEKVVKEIKLKGYRVAVIKHSHHDIDIDRPGKDSWRLAQAGSDIVAISSPKRLAFIEHVDSEPTLAQIEALFRGRVDIVLVEGHKHSDTAKILVLNGQQDQEPLCYEGKLLATISAHSSSSGVPQFNSGDVIDIVNLLIGRIPVEDMAESPLYRVAGNECREQVNDSSLCFYPSE